jgi:N-formylglutamate amidohydrolase
MDCRVEADAGQGRGLEVWTPREQRLPVVLASPHSGREYPADFLTAARLDALTLRKSEDGYVDEIFEAGPGRGAPLVKALFPRAFLDANREPFELDPEMFEDYLPSYVNTRSPRVAAGLGTIARVVAHGHEIYGGKLRFGEALDRVNRLYFPYHDTVKRLIAETRRRFGFCILLDCHSMPSAGGVVTRNGRQGRIDFVLGDCYGSACAAVVTSTAERWLEGRGYVVHRNAPYAGGYTTRHYGRPRFGVHAMQIEINRALYMDEARMSRGPFLATLAGEMGDLVEALGRIDAGLLCRP